LNLNKVALTIEEVRKIAFLSRLRLTAEDEQRFLVQLGSIVDYIGQLSNFEVSEPDLGVPTLPEAADSAAPCLPREVVTGNAPEAAGGFLVVPQVRAGDDG
jgi:aspartyl-tRNA(Asn)/glutamyl-tRNA(Gln) amidotransferase subunit C